MRDLSAGAAPASHSLENRPVVVIYVRFSLISVGAGGAWKGQRLSKDIEAYAARILTAERINTRSDIFFGYSLPLLKKAANENPDLDIQVVLHSSSLLPDDLKERLASLENDYSFMNVAFFDPEDACDFKYELKRFMQEHYRHRRSTFTVPIMRLDDDDLLSPIYFSILKKYLKDEFLGYTIHTPRGYEALYSGGGFIAYTHMDAPKTGIGLAHLAQWSPEQDQFISQYLLPPGKHSDTDKYAPVILDGSKNAIFRTKHSFNDARATREGYSFNEEEELEKRFFRERIDPNDGELHENFPTLKRV